LIRFIQARFEEQSEKLRQSVLSFMDVPKSVLEIAQSILPPDDSSLQWSEAGGGITDDPTTTLEAIYDRMVQRYKDDDYEFQHARKNNLWHLYEPMSFDLLQA
jgi:hypothetical protein